MASEGGQASDNLWAGLSCSVLEPGLRSVLLIGARPYDILATAEAVSRFLSAPHTVVLRSCETDEDLWGRVSIAGAGEPTLVWRPGLLASQSATVVAIPDLSRAGLAATRAMVALIGADVAHLERQGESTAWRPNYFWIAGCASTSIGEVSPHLLDRFALRLSFDPSSPVLDQVTEMPISWGERIRDAGTTAVLDKELLARILHASNGEGFRRALALSRLTRAYARLARLERADSEHFDEVAALIGLHVAANTTTKPSTQVPIRLQDNVERDEIPEPRPGSPSQRRRAGGATIAQPRAQVAASTVPDEPEQEQVLAAAPVQFTPYPEDHTPTLREAESLRLPPRPAQTSRAGSGVIMGTQPAMSKRDIAWVATILRSARYRRIRQRAGHESETLLIRRSDLRSYRRAPTPQRLLVILLDATAVNGCRWDEAISPYLRWAYVERAAIHVVHVGVGETPDDSLRARLITGRNLLAPSIAKALNPVPGSATPLAHGLDLALRAIRNRLHHGRSRIDQVVFAVITDGRGNVPLDTSLRGHLDREAITGRRGIEDAFRIASEIAALQNLRAVVLHPRLTVLKHLPLELAALLQASTIEIAPREAAQD
jgi:magnesium chelatase subunit D